MSDLQRLAGEGIQPRPKVEPTYLQKFTDETFKAGFIEGQREMQRKADLLAFSMGQNEVGKAIRALPVEGE